MKRLIFSILICVFAWGVKAQEIDALFVSMPDKNITLSATYRAMTNGGILDRNEISQNKIMKMIVEAKGDE